MLKCTIQYEANITSKFNNKKILVANGKCEMVVSSYFKYFYERQGTFLIGLLIFKLNIFLHTRQN